MHLQRFYRIPFRLESILIERIAVLETSLPFGVGFNTVSGHIILNRSFRKKAAFSIFTRQELPIKEKIRVKSTLFISGDSIFDGISIWNNLSILNNTTNQWANLSTITNAFLERASEKSTYLMEDTKDSLQPSKKTSTRIFGTRPIYLDMQATTPVDPRVLDAMLPYYTYLYGNSHSRTHSYGWETDRAVQIAREHVANLICADPKEIFFTSGATESNNMIIKGVAHFYSGTKKHIITAQTEHKCVLDSCRILQNEGFDVTYLPVNQKGLISLEELERTIRQDTILVSIMTVNNEIGVIQPIEEIGKICRSKKVFFHTDAAQAAGKIPIDVNAFNVDLMSLSGHKIYGPKGVGASYVRRRPRVRVEPLINGGGQERGLRSGTIACPLVIGMGEACRIAKEELEYDYAHVSRLSKRLVERLTQLEYVFFNGDQEHRYPGCINASFAYVEGESLLMALKDIALSSGSACTSASLEPSYVIRSLGVPDDISHSSLRFGIGRFTTDKEIDYICDTIKDKVNFLRELSPLWEMVQEGVDLSTIKWSYH
ncbi:cysteine desulfurase, mitochondrial [Pneumocystis jirovecii RU7]|uniref:cysteine desulfurase n=1 Tax=Pneumocystis jirovecii (strain RU7) TaxID=1408657 RepID=A0A0W4ZMB8_PNEJ7|nr:cysteine desulfurase, mitochondrial [Pneumocystis jirovecii RU7]KTW29505.1 cysteine desulfurase, mitochondrial [Pneumocystis jirovecii RU7]